LPVMRALLVLAVLAMLSCGAPVDNRVPCSSQTTCDAQNRKVCDTGFCSAALPDISKHYENLYFSVPAQVQIANPKAYRVAILYATTPGGKTVRCPGATLAANQVAIPGMAALVDASKFNQTAPLTESQFHNSIQGHDLVQTAGSVNGSGRVVYVE